MNKDILTKTKNWCEEHKKEIAIVGGMVVFGGMAYFGLKRNKSRNVVDALDTVSDVASNVAMNFEDDAADLGRDCIMTFTVEETGEKIGEALCTELFAREMMGME